MKKEETTTLKKLTFSGHDTFHCRQLWLKKGYDFIKNGKKFVDDDAVITLGVGKNMVSAIHFWMKAFGLLDKNGNTTDFANYIFDSDNGKDPYLEDNATLWLLHYQLITQNLSSTYNYIFNDLRKERIEFTKDNFLSFIERKSSEVGFSQFNKKTVSTDFDVFLKTYNRTDEQVKDREDTFSGLLTDLNLLQEEKRKLDDKRTVTYYSLPNTNRSDIPEEIILYTILDGKDFQKSISFNTISQDTDQAGLVFAIGKSALLEKIQGVIANPKYKKYGLILNDHAGIKELQFSTKPEKFEVLNNYYGN
ncbi:hypothetical protein IX39_12325 [Chryseobacterium formosense]|uniref:DUF4007 domain-containing protein n=1 Tax=Chryseobacterium formosense TaxID=236814 RepID=A0A085ZA90_9FLAO|nr:DUF4007 family protein [Chryseobacterium formosense]KFF01354.1 hypothetical protein IX39_12325 [Chryseobacterium formosense]SFT46142.1 Protein of unknown function [Chryseobacterium formosense]